MGLVKTSSLLLLFFVQLVCPFWGQNVDSVIGTLLTAPLFPIEFCFLDTASLIMNKCMPYHCSIMLREISYERKGHLVWCGEAHILTEFMPVPVSVQIDRD